jgi:hypothetical protein
VAADVESSPVVDVGDGLWRRLVHQTWVVGSAR